MLAFKNLEALLTFIETYLSKYFDLDQKIPDAYMLLERGSLKEIVTTAKKNAFDKGIDGRLIEIALFPIDDFMDEGPRKNITYRRLIYFKGLMQDLNSLLQSGGETDLKSEVIQLLVYRNFNSHYLLVYLTATIRLEVQSQPTLSAQMDKFNYWTKLFNQFHVKPGSALKYDMSSIKDQLVTWLEQEITYLEKKKQLTLPLASPEQGSEADNFKVQTNLSVAQLALFIRLLKELGYVENKNQTELLTFFARHLGSVRNENISPDSLRAKYYNIERTAVNSVQAILTKMIERSKKGGWILFYAASDWTIDLLADLAAGVLIM